MQHRSQDWAEPGVAATWQATFFYWMMRWGGKARGYHLGWISSLWFVAFYPSIRQRCAFYLDRRFPQRRGGFRRLLDTFRMVSSFASTLVDMLVLSKFGPASFEATCPDRERLSALAQGERGFVLVHSHVGCWQIGMSTLGQFHKNVSIVMIPDPVMGKLFDPGAATPIDPRTGLQSAMQMTEALLRGDILAMMGDRTFGNDQNVVAARFLGGTVQFPITPYRLASATGVPVVVLTAPKTRMRTYELRLAKVIKVPPGLGRNARDYAPYAQQFADCMEQFVEQYPWQYFNFYNVWEERDAPRT